MSSYAEVIDGAPAWLPSQRSEMVAVLREHDGPRLGIFRQEDLSVLFGCITGSAEPSALWFYVVLMDDEVGQLEAARGEELQALATELFTRDAVVAAFSRYDQIVAAVPMPDRIKDFSELWSIALLELSEELDRRVQIAEAGRDEIGALVSEMV